MAGRSLISFISILALGAILAALFNVGLHATNNTEFCTSCHSMQNNLKELRNPFTGAALPVSMRVAPTAMFPNSSSPR